MDYSLYKPSEIRKLIREEVITSQTSGMCNGYAQANLLILPKEYAYDFLLFCQRNPKSCPLLEVGDMGDPIIRYMADNANVCSDLPKYRIWKDGELVKEVNNIEDYWNDNLVYFLIGCSFSFESELIENGIEIRHITEKKNVPMYLTDIETSRAGIFHGKLVVSMRPLPEDQVELAKKITASMARVHGAPIYAGDPEKIGIKDINKPDFGDSVTIKDGEIPVFWCCGVTPQSCVMSTKPSFAISHSPGHMFITDIKNSDLKY